MTKVRSLMQHPCIIGKLGEHQTTQVLSALPTEYFIRNNVLIPNGHDGTSQIDHVILSPYAIFVVESKNIHGRVVGRRDDRFWTVQGSDRAYDLYNPIRQNEGHIRALRSILGDLTPTVYVNLVVFGKGATLCVDADESVGQADELGREICRYRNTRFTIDQVHQLDEWLREAYSSVHGTERHHVKRVKSHKR